MFEDGELKEFQIALLGDFLNTTVSGETFQNVIRHLTGTPSYKYKVPGLPYLRDLLCYKIAKSKQGFETLIYEKIFDEYESDGHVVAYLAENPNISLELAKKIHKTNLSSESQLALASNPGEKLTLKFLQGVNSFVKIKGVAVEKIRELVPVGRVHYKNSNYAERVNEAVKQNIKRRAVILGQELNKSCQIFGGKPNQPVLTYRRDIDLTQSVLACNELGEFLLTHLSQPTLELTNN